MSSSLNHYTADVQVTDAVMHNKTPLSTSTFVSCRPGCQCDRCQGSDPGVLWPHGDVLQDHQWGSHPVSGCHSQRPWRHPDCHGDQCRSGDFPNCCRSCCRFYFGAGDCCCCACCRRRDFGCCCRGRRNTSSCSSASCFNSYQHCEAAATTETASVIDATASPAATTAVTDTTTATVAATVPSTPAPTLEGRWTRTARPSQWILPHRLRRLPLLQPLPLLPPRQVSRLPPRLRPQPAKTTHFRERPTSPPPWRAS